MSKIESFQLYWSPTTCPGSSHGDEEVEVIHIRGNYTQDIVEHITCDYKKRWINEGTITGNVILNVTCSEKDVEPELYIFTNNGTILGNVETFECGASKQWKTFVNLGTQHGTVKQSGGVCKD